MKNTYCRAAKPCFAEGPGSGFVFSPVIESFLRMIVPPIGQEKHCRHVIKKDGSSLYSPDDDVMKHTRRNRRAPCLA
jgi:hypothetical protein